MLFFQKNNNHNNNNNNNKRSKQVHMKTNSHTTKDTNQKNL